MKINIKLLIFCIIITFFIGSFFSLFTSPAMYENLNKSIAVPKIVFPVVWSILYLLMSISLYLILQKSKNNKAIQLYFTQLIFNSLWTLIFFGFKLYFLSFIWILILTIMIVIMIYEFYHLSKIASFINIPYLLWVIFASYLNLTILLLN